MSSAALTIVAMPAQSPAMLSSRLNAFARASANGPTIVITMPEARSSYQEGCDRARRPLLRSQLARAPLGHELQPPLETDERPETMSGVRALRQMIVDHPTDVILTHVRAQ